MVNKLVILFIFLSTSLWAKESDEIEQQNQYKEFALQTGKVYKIYVKKKDGTVIKFPSKISEITGGNVTTAPQKTINGYEEPYLLSIEPKKHYYFTVTALEENKAATITVIYNRKSYILYLVYDPSQAYAVVSFSNGRSVAERTGVQAPDVSSERLISLINMAKAYDLILPRYPNQLRDTQRYKCDVISQFDKFKIHLKEVVRFNQDDTLIFKCIMENPNNYELAYDRYSFTAQVKDKVFYMSAADASGIMPPRSRTYAYFSITGDQYNNRNNLAPENNFSIGVTAKYMLEPAKKEMKAGSEDNSSRKKIDSKKKELKTEEQKSITNKINDEYQKRLKEIISENKMLKNENRMMLSELIKKNVPQSIAQNGGKK